MATIRKLKSGNFQVIIKQSGLKIITKTFPTKRLAVQFQREAEGNTKLLNALGKPIPNLITFSEIVEQYLKADEVKEQPDQTNPLRKPKTVYKSKDPSREGRLKYWCDLFGSKPILTITDDLIDDGLLELAETRTGATVNRYKSNLSAIFIYFNEHKKYKKLKHPNPVKGEFVSNFSASQEKERFLTDDEQIA